MTHVMRVGVHGRTDLLPHETGFFQPKESERYRRLDVIGEGTYGEVYRAMDTHTGCIVALKKLRGKTTVQRNVLRELSILRLVQQHPNVVCLLNVIPSMGTRVEIVTEYIPKNLEVYNMSFLRRHQLLPMRHVRSILRQLTAALLHLEDCGVMHRDLKPSNVLIDADETDPDAIPIAKLCDFGSARLLIDHPDDPFPFHTPTEVTTPCWRAPEVFLGSQGYDTAVDMWALGCIFAELLTGEILFHSKEDNDFDFIRLIFERLGTPRSDAEWGALLLNPQRHRDGTCGQFQGDPNEFPQFRGKGLAECGSGMLGQRAGPQGLDLIQGMLQLDPRDRITPSVALAHPFFVDEVEP